MISETASLIPSDVERYKRAWRSLRLRRWIAFGLFALYLPVVGTFALVFSHDPEREGAVAAKIWLAGCAIGTIWLSLFHCPRCGKLFGISWAFSNPIARKCLHCGLPVGSQPDAIPAPD
jgi:hypothetical protein